MKVLTGKHRQLTDTMSIVRVLPQVARRHVGPFVFLDHFGPTTVGPEGMDVPPHPHIGLATVSVLFEGAIRHRDSLGSDAWIRPGAVNWMTSGRGIVHSERTEDYQGPLHGLQLWVALPDDEQDGEPRFHHHPATTLPTIEAPGIRVDVMVGSWGDTTSPVATLGPTHLALAELAAESTLEIPVPADGEELGVFVVRGRAQVGGTTVDSDALVVLDPAHARQACWQLRAEGPTRLAVLGGKPVGPRTIVWNFVHSDPETIRRAKEDWRAQRFPEVPGDRDERIPLP